jgi:hypothetical protein
MNGKPNIDKKTKHKIKKVEKEKKTGGHLIDICWFWFQFLPLSDFWIS